MRIMLPVNELCLELPEQIWQAAADLPKCQDLVLPVHMKNGSRAFVILSNTFGKRIRMVLRAEHQGSILTKVNDIWVCNISGIVAASKLSGTPDPHEDMPLISEPDAGDCQHETLISEPDVDDCQHETTAQMPSCGINISTQVMVEEATITLSCDPDTTCRTIPSEGTSFEQGNVADKTERGEKLSTETSDEYGVVVIQPDQSGVEKVVVESIDTTFGVKSESCHTHPSTCQYLDPLSVHHSLLPQSHTVNEQTELAETFHYSLTDRKNKFSARRKSRKQQRVDMIEETEKVLNTTTVENGNDVDIGSGLRQSEPQGQKRTSSPSQPACPIQLNSLVESNNVDSDDHQMADSVEQSSISKTKVIRKKKGNVKDEDHLSSAEKKPKPYKRRVRIDKERFICEYCGSSYSRLFSLKDHMDFVHCGKKPENYQCDVCTKLFRSYSRLMHHKPVHMDERNFQCSICGKTYKTKRHLRQHTRLLHEKKYPYHCEKCGHGLHTRGFLKSHQCGRVRRHDKDDSFMAVN